MTITIHWWTIPTILSVLYVVWMLWPTYRSNMWGDIEAFFGAIFGGLIVSISWAIAGVFFK